MPRLKSVLRYSKITPLALAIILWALPSALYGQDGDTDSAGEGDGCIDCSLCRVQGKMGNKAPPGDGTSVHSQGSGSHGHCVPSGGCTEQHPINAGCLTGTELASAAVLNGLIHAVKEADSRLAYGIFANHRSFIRYNSERIAFQAFGCGGSLLAHIPFSSRLVPDLVATLNAQEDQQP